MSENYTNPVEPSTTSKVATTGINTAKEAGIGAIGGGAGGSVAGSVAGALGGMAVFSVLALGSGLLFGAIGAFGGLGALSVLGLEGGALGLVAGAGVPLAIGATTGGFAGGAGGGLLGTIVGIISGSAKGVDKSIQDIDHQKGMYNVNATLEQAAVAQQQALQTLQTQAMVEQQQRSEALQYIQANPQVVANDANHDGVVVDINQAKQTQKPTAAGDGHTAVVNQQALEDAMQPAEQGV